MSRALAVPAVLCLLAGLALGVWGWGQRDEARARILPDVEVDEGDGFFAPPPEVEERVDGVAQVCGILLAASRVEALAPGPAGAPSSSVAGTPAEISGVLLTVLDPMLVAGYPGLDRLDVVAAIAAERGEVERVQAAGGDPTTDPGVVAAGRDLGQVLQTTC